MVLFSYAQASTCRYIRIFIVACLFSGPLAACGEESSTSTGVDTSGGAEQAVIAAAVAWSTTTSADVRELEATVVDSGTDAAEVRLVGDVRYPPSGLWEPFRIIVPVFRQGENVWIAPATTVIDRLMRSSRSATAVAEARARPSLTPTATAESSPSPTPTAAPITPPPPPEGVVVYLSNWSSGLDGWIGTPDWVVEAGKLINDGSRASSDPWLEAPVRVEAWRPMIVEFEMELLEPEFGSFGLIARGGVAGWLNLGVRWEADVAEGESPTSATLGATLRPGTQRVPEEWAVTPIQFDPGVHQFRIELLADGIVMHIDGAEVARTDEGTFLTGEFLGLWSNQTPLAIHYFRVTLV